MTSHVRRPAASPQAIRCQPDRPPQRLPGPRALVRIKLPPDDQAGGRVLAAARIRRVRPEHWWLVLFAILFLGFFLALLFQPAVGRGGR